MSYTKAINFRLSQELWGHTRLSFRIASLSTGAAPNLVRPNQIPRCARYVKQLNYGLPHNTSKSLNLLIPENVEIIDAIISTDAIIAKR